MSQPYPIHDKDHSFPNFYELELALDFPSLQLDMPDLSAHVSSFDKRYAQVPTPAQSAHSRSPSLALGSEESSAPYQLDHPISLTPVAESLDRQLVKEEEVTTISISTAFNPSSHSRTPDTIFRTSDQVWFYGHVNVLISRCPGAFQTLLGAPLSNPRFRDGPIPIDIPSAEFNVIMHMLYDSSPAAHSPSFETLVQAVDRLPLLDIKAKRYILPNTPLYSQFLSFSPLKPMEIFVMAGHHDLYDLAARCSSHLLSLSLSTITDEQAERMGAIYLRRLLVLHINRIQELRTILMKVPEFHPATKGCSFTDQKAVSRAWALGSASLIWDAHPDLPTGIIKSTLSQLSEHLTCPQCKDALQERVKEVVARWTSTTRTI